ncbi:MAG: hypothetical protein EXX96DRAFT_549211 [Benjaminiella poitrasii]|nr:MAG: hypothetical protein EXX96DRAFT_549211 [Benjaminiella poitrasii]
MEEEEICRVCRSESTPEQPLFHPCKCAGSIRYVHQECLIEWLSHSRKKYCELCGHPFTFTPVYRQDMPEVLPVRLFLKQLQKKTIFVVVKTLRAILVSCIWLVLLPYFTIWVWRLYFFLGSHFSKHFMKLQRMGHQFGLTKNTSVELNLNSYDNETTAVVSWLHNYKNRLTIQTFLSDCFEGQIITCIVVVIFVAIFLLREWIVQNIPMDPPPVEEDMIQDVILVDQPERQEREGILEEVIQEDEEVFRDSNQRMEELFNVPWDMQQRVDEREDNPPSSPIALNDIIWFGEEASSSSSILNEEPPKPPRAVSMPPSLSASGSFHDFEDQNSNTIVSQLTREQAEFRRSTSMELFVDSRFTDSSNLQNQTTEQNQGASLTSIHRGYPPNAPRIRHAEAPPSTQPILEEVIEEEEQNIIAPVEPAPVQAGNNIVDEDEDEEDENIEEFEGILEAIGMQGSLWSLAQNCSLMAILIALCLAVTVWMPYLIGMIFIMTDTLDFIRFPLKAVRWITDPLVDFLFMICTEYVKPWLINTIYQQHLQSIFNSISSIPIYNQILDSFTHIYSYIINQLLFFSNSFSNTAVVTDNIIPSITSNHSSFIITSVAKFINETEPIFESAFRRYQALAVGQSAFDRFACVFIGYMIAAVTSCWYFTRSLQRNLAVAAFGRTAQEVVRQQSMIFKVGMFITIELVMFPIICGFLLDFSTLPLLRAATLMSRITYLRMHPIPSIFLHWFLGTGFMFLFAVLVTLCREAVRPGVMWFIRDPNDPQFHPIREIIERPILFQFKKIGASALIYLTVILVGVGSVIHLIHLASGHILPLRWNLSSPLSIVPVDLIVVQVCIPALVKYFQPKQTVKQLFFGCVAFACRQLRLTSFMFGGRRMEEEGTLAYHNWLAWIKRRKPSHYPAEGSCENVIGADVSYIWDGQLLRVPRHDSVPIVERRRMLVPVDNRTFEPLDETERRLGHPAATAAGDDEVNTVIVYSPPHFKLRLLIFVGFMWLSITAFCCAVSICPVMLGRYAFKEGFHIENEVHDVYSFMLGGFILLLSGALLTQTYKSIKDIASQSTAFDALVSLWCHTKQWYLWVIFEEKKFRFNLGILIQCYSFLDGYFSLFHSV